MVVFLVGIVNAKLRLSDSKRPILLYLLNACGQCSPGIATMFLFGILSRRTTLREPSLRGLLFVNSSHLGRPI